MPDMKIEPGEKTDEPIRTRGWTHWHHLFGARQLSHRCVASWQCPSSAAVLRPTYFKVLDYAIKVVPLGWRGHPGSSPQVMATFTNQALNTSAELWNEGFVSFSNLYF